MKRRHAVLAALAASVTLVPVTAAGVGTGAEQPKNGLFGDNPYGTLGPSSARAARIDLVSAAAAGRAAGKQRVEILIEFHASTFALSPSASGALKRDTGTITDNAPNAPCRDVVRNGVTNDDGLCGGRWTLTGKRGTLMFRTQAEWRDGGSPASCGVAFGTWKIVRGTGQYAGITGGGLSAYDAHCQKWYARHEGFLVAKGA